MDTDELDETLLETARRRAAALERACAGLTTEQLEAGVIRRAMGAYAFAVARSPSLMPVDRLSQFDPAAMVRAMDAATATPVGEGV